MRNPLSGLALALYVATAVACGAETTPARMNVLFITADDLRPWLGSYGASQAFTPHLDRLAAEGVAFERAYVQQAWCSPSRTSVLTGLRPDTTRVYDLVTHFREHVPDAVTLPQYFRSHGYVTAGWGKVFHEGMDDEASWSVPPPPSLTFGGATGGTFFYGTPEKIADAATNTPRGYSSPTEVGANDPGLYPDDRLTGAAVEFIRKHRETPFFLALGFYKPHMPFTAPARYWDLHAGKTFSPAGPAEPPSGAPASALLARAEHNNYRGLTHLAGQPVPDHLASELIHGYLACTSFIDDQVGRLMTALEELGLRERTIVVFWGDHGWKLGEYGQWSKNSNFEVDTRIPLIVSGPGVRMRRRTTAIVEALDLYPTLAELAGLPIPREIEGRSFAALLSGERDSHKNAAFSQVIRNAARTYTTYGLATEMGQAVRTDRYRFVRWLRRGDAQPFAFELYDHASDPEETVNVADRPEHAAVLKALDALLEENFRDPFPR